MGSTSRILLVSVCSATLLASAPSASAHPINDRRGNPPGTRADTETIRARPADRRSDAPEEAVRALEENRFFHASLILREFLSAAKDTAAADLLLAARAEAGWGDWQRVERLLAGEPWLDTLDGGLGWNLLGRSYLEAKKWEASRRALSRYLEVATGASDRDRGEARVYLARAAMGAGDAAGAIESYDFALSLLAGIADWIVLDITVVAAAAGDTAQVAARLASMDTELAREWGWRYRVDSFLAAGDTAGALAVAQKAAGELVSSNRRAQALVRLGSLRLDRGDVVGARDAFRRAIQTSPGGSGGVDGARLLTDVPGITAADRLLIGRTYLRHGNLQRGIAGVKAYLDAGNGTASERERLRYELGNAYFRAGRYRDAETTLTGIVERNIMPSLAADALYLAARSQYRDGRVTLARRTFLDVAARYPAAEAAARAMYLSADLDHDDGNIERATERYRRTTGLSPDAEEVGLAHMRLGGLAYQRGDWTSALEEFDGYRGRYPNGRRYVQATYWAALSSRRLGDHAGADARLREVLRMDPLSYYGGRAADLLGIGFWDLPLRASPATDEGLAGDVRDALASVDLLVRLEQTDAAAYEIDRIRQRFAASRPALYTLAEELNARGYTMNGIAIGWDLFRRDGGWSERLLRIIYPFPFERVILAEAGERQVDPFLAAGLIRQESMFNVAAVSGAGAIGLMQVMPATGQSLARQLGVRGFDADMLKHPELNAHLGMRYLSEQLASFEGRLPVVLAAYNAGPQRIDRWQDFPEFMDDEQFAERIPFGETRDYVKIVQNNARIYRELYGDAVGAARGEN